MTTFHRIYKFGKLGQMVSFTLGAVLFLSSCSGLESTSIEESEGPISILTGKPSKDGIKFSDLTKKDQPSSEGLPVNALLWRAALDIASFVPLDDVDTFGGSIVTEWYQTQDKTDQRLKLAMFVIGRELRSDAITVRAYVQKRLNNDWVDAGRDEALSRRLEDLVLSRARELRAAATAETVN